MSRENDEIQGVEETNEELGMEAHTDRNMLTILCQKDVKDGLQVRTSDDKQWIKADPSQKISFIVLGGAMLPVGLKPLFVYIFFELRMKSHKLKVGKNHN
ncbi:hypothetical protein Bca52824_033388 [Brassica carinata]|uniref:Isopenicillin N synthase-like Fe(2+) 2OG dioxygenase domain-containing protein n=1 Tax=Brassica carinata TaxID=52824 RepID=A0A8X7SEX2_BRACI|nr:hypothetical protein Bca52824_033388 [Brassica carinata]